MANRRKDNMRGMRLDGIVKQLQDAALQITAFGQDPRVHAETAEKAMKDYPEKNKVLVAAQYILDLVEKAEKQALCADKIHIRTQVFNPLNQTTFSIRTCARTDLALFELQGYEECDERGQPVKKEKKQKAPAAPASE